MSKAQKRTIIAVSCIFAILSTFVLFWYFGDTYSQFYPIAKAEFEIVGLESGYTPQGLTYESNSNIFLTCGYMKDGSASRIYVVDGQSKETTKYFTLKNGETFYTGHAGGIATDGQSVWIAGDGKVFRFAFTDIETVTCGKYINIIDSFESQNGADFLTVENNNLWVGEFHRNGNYNTAETHHFKVSDKETNMALSFCYTINSSKEFGLENTTPTKALSTGSLVQGMEITDNKIILSTSYSLSNSHIKIYNNILKSTADTTFEINEEKIPVYILDSNDQTKDIEAPSMSEEITIANDKVYVLFESACKKYEMVTREQVRNVHSIALDNL